MTKQDALKKIEELKAYVERLDKQWPQIGDKYWFVSTYGSIEPDYHQNHPVDLGRIRMGNVFRTEKEAEQHALRLESMTKRDWIPEVGEKYWTWKPISQCPAEANWDNDYADHLNYYLGMFKTKEECQAWGKKYADAWKIPIKK